MFKKRLTDRIKSGGASLTGAARHLAGQSTEAFDGLRAMFSGDDDALGIEDFLLALVAAVRDENDDELRSEKDVRKSASRRRRKLAVASFVTGPFAGLTLQITDLYCDAATVCEVAGARGLRLSDREAAAQLLLLWSITDSPDDALRTMHEDDELHLIELLSERMRGQVEAVLPEQYNKRSVLRLLWRSRGMANRVRERYSFATAAMAAVRPGKDVNNVIAEIERNLEATLRSGVHGILGPGSEPDAPLSRSA